MHHAIMLAATAAPLYLWPVAIAVPLFHFTRPNRPNRPDGD